LGISVEGVICVVDSKNFDSYKENSTAQYQLGGSNIIVMNKTDLISDEEAVVVEAEIREIKEKFDIKNTMTGKPIFKNYVLHRAEQGLVNKEVFEGIYRVEDVVELALDHQHLDHTVKDSLTQKVAYFKEGIKFQDVDDILEKLPKNIYRVKGVVRVEDVPNAIFINYAFGDVSFEELVAYEGKSLLIFIGENIDKDVADLCDASDTLSLPRFTV